MSWASGTVELALRPPNLVLVAILAACGPSENKPPPRVQVAPLTIPPLGAHDGGGIVQTPETTPRVVVKAIGPRRPGDHVEVEWHGAWYPAVLLAPRGGDWLVHYEGYEESWDEVVGDDRIRDPMPGR